jgi:hypothetical protein
MQFVSWTCPGENLITSRRQTAARREAQQDMRGTGGAGASQWKVKQNLAGSILTPVKAALDAVIPRGEYGLGQLAGNLLVLPSV